MVHFQTVVILCAFHLDKQKNHTWEKNVHLSKIYTAGGGCGRGWRAERGPELEKVWLAEAGLSARLPCRDTANNTHMWGVRSLLELGRWRSGLPTPTPLSFLHKKKCRAVVWHPRRLDTAPADGVSLAGSGVRACISEPAPEMWWTTHAGAPRAEDEATEGPPRPGDHRLHTPRLATEVG